MVSPAYLLVIFALWCYKNFPARVNAIRAMNSEDQATVLLILAFMVVVLVSFGLLVNLAGKRWRAAGRLCLEAADGTAAARPRITPPERATPRGAWGKSLGLKGNQMRREGSWAPWMSGGFPGLILPRPWQKCKPDVQESYFFFVSRKSGDSARVKSTTSSPVVVLIS